MYTLQRLEKLTKEINDLANKRNYEYQLDDLRAGTGLIHDRVQELLAQTWWQRFYEWLWVRRDTK